MPLVGITDLNASINNKPFFEQPVKKQTRSIGKLVLKYQERMIIQQDTD